jgi:hypothetical protein
MGSGNQPNFNLVFTAKDGREYVKGPNVGMWDADKGPKARGSIKGEYLEKLIDFLKDFDRDGVSVALFENDGKGSGRRSGGRDRDEDRHSDRGRDEREERSSRRDRDEDEDRGSRRSRDDDDDGDEFGKDRERGSSRRESSERSSSRKSAPKKTTKKGRK